MPEFVQEGLMQVIQLVEICGASLLVIGFCVATWNWALGFHITGPKKALLEYRQALGRTVLIGLEVLVAATVIKTITLEPSLEGLGLLLGMIVIRTAIGWTTVLEIEGQWPWQHSKVKPKSSTPQ